MKSKYLFAFLVLSTTTFSACDSTYTQGQGANADGSCNGAIQADAQTFESEMLSAESSIQEDETAGFVNFSDLENQVSTAQSECNDFVANYGSTVCTSTSPDGSVYTFDGSTLAQDCAQMTITSDCDNNYQNAYVNIAVIANQSVAPYINATDGTLSSLGQTDPSAFAAAATSLASPCAAFEASYQNAPSCSVTLSSTTYALNAQYVNTLCAEVSNAESTHGLSSIVASLTQIQTPHAVKSNTNMRDLTATLKKVGI